MYGRLSCPMKADLLFEEHLLPERDVFLAGYSALMLLDRLSSYTIVYGKPLSGPYQRNSLISSNMTL